MESVSRESIISQTEKDELAVARLRLIWDQTPQALIGIIVCLIAVVVVLWDQTDRAVMVIWSGAALGAILIQGVGYLWFRRRDKDDDSIQQWSHDFNATLLLNGVLWGAGGVLLITSDSLSHTVFVGFLLGAISTGSVATFASVRYASPRFFIPVILPFSITLFILGSELRIAIAFMMIVYLVILWVFSGNMYRAVDGALRLQIENRELLDNLQKSRKSETEAAERVQQMLLFGATPRSLKGATLSAEIVTARHVSGDFYDIYRHGESCFDILVGDVMGKGIPAAMIGAATKSRFLQALAQRAVIADDHRLPQPEEIVRFVHGRFTNQLSALGSFVTILYARFDIENNRLISLNCGHPPGIHFRRAENRIEYISSENAPLGFNPDESYRQQIVTLNPGDMIFLFSDGATEARSPDGEQYGQERIVELILRSGVTVPSDLVEMVKDDVAAFSQSTQVHDDLTCVAVAIEEEESGATAQRGTLETSIDLSELKSIRDFIHQFCEQGSEPLLGSDQMAEVVLAVTEVASNIMKHSYQGRPDGTIRTTVEAHDDRITIRLQHYGESLKSTLIPPELPEETESGGRGLFIIDKSVDSVVYSREEDGSSAVTLTKMRGD